MFFNFKIKEKIKRIPNKNHKKRNTSGLESGEGNGGGKFGDTYYYLRKDVRKDAKGPRQNTTDERNDAESTSYRAKSHNPRNKRQNDWIDYERNKRNETRHPDQ